MTQSLPATTVSPAILAAIEAVTQPLEGVAKAKPLLKAPEHTPHGANALLPNSVTSIVASFFDLTEKDLSVTTTTPSPEELRVIALFATVCGSYSPDDFFAALEEQIKGRVCFPEVKEIRWYMQIEPPQINHLDSHIGQLLKRLDELKMAFSRDDLVAKALAMIEQEKPRFNSLISLITTLKGASPAAKK